MNTYTFLTPPGQGAIGVIQVQGISASECVDQIFVSLRGILVSEVSCDRVLYGKILKEDVVVCRTGEDVVEIHSHGSPVAMRRIAQLLEVHGVKELSYEKFLERHYTNKIQRIAAEMLPHATTWRISSIIMDQYNGALRDALLEIDMEQVPERRQNLKEKLFCWQHIAKHLLVPWKIIFAGPTNVGKSSLFNALLGFSRVLVDDRAGTTRDLVKENFTFDGWNFLLVDTAGWREGTEDEIEKGGMRRAEEEMADADLILMVHDARDFPHFVEGFTFPPEKKCLHVWNKCDLCQSSPLINEKENSVFVSAKWEESMPVLCEKILKILIPVTPKPGTAIPIGLV
ncbi:MAG: 50S ribosome-binding GTPase [Planctomycetia bacterium]|nr:50S ribosome-binding GTPase [Planctomycetia bacterium]